MAILLTLSLLTLASSAPINQNDPQPFVFNFTFTTLEPQNVTSSLVIDPNSVVQQDPIDASPRGPAAPSNDPLPSETPMVSQAFETTNDNQPSNAPMTAYYLPVSMTPSESLQDSTAPSSIILADTPLESDLSLPPQEESIFSSTMFSPILQDVDQQQTPIFEGSANVVTDPNVPMQNDQSVQETSAADPNMFTIASQTETGTPVFVMESSSSVNTVLRNAPADPVVPAAAINAENSTTLGAFTQTDAVDEAAPMVTQEDITTPNVMVTPAPTDPTADAMNDEVAPLINVVQVQADSVQKPDENVSTQTPPPVNTAVGPLEVVPLAVPVQSDQQPQLDFVNSNEAAGYNAAYQYLNLTDSLASNFVLNISLPQSPIGLLTRLQASTNKMNYADKLDVALQLTAFVHSLMSSVDDDLTLQEKH